MSGISYIVSVVAAIVIGVAFIYFGLARWYKNKGNNDKTKH